MRAGVWPSNGPVERICELLQNEVSRTGGSRGSHFLASLLCVPVIGHGAEASLLLYGIDYDFMLRMSS